MVMYDVIIIFTHSNNSIQFWNKIKQNFEI